MDKYTINIVFIVNRFKEDTEETELFRKILV